MTTTMASRVRWTDEHATFIESQLQAGYTLDDLGAHFGVSGERVRQIAERFGITYRSHGRTDADPVAIMEAVRNPAMTTLDDLAVACGTPKEKLVPCLRALGIRAAVSRLLRWRRTQPTRVRLATAIQILAARLGRTPTLFEIADQLGIQRTAAGPSLVHAFGSIRQAMRYAGVVPRKAGDCGQINPRKGRHQTHCRRGHEMTPENTYVSRNTRSCRTCQTANNRRAYCERKRIA